MAHHIKTLTGEELSEADDLPSGAQDAWRPPHTGTHKRVSSLLQSLDAAEESASLEEHTETSTCPAQQPITRQLDADALLRRIALVQGFCGGVVLDIEWGEVLGASPSQDLDIELAAQLALADLPRLQGQWPEEMSTTSATHHEFIFTLHTPLLTLLCYTLWQRSNTNYALSRAAIQDALTAFAL